MSTEEQLDIARGITTMGVVHLADIKFDDLTQNVD